LTPFVDSKDVFIMVVGSSSQWRPMVDAGAAMSVLLSFVKKSVLMVVVIVDAMKMMKTIERKALMIVSMGDAKRKKKKIAVVIVMVGGIIFVNQLQNSFV